MPFEPIRVRPSVIDIETVVDVANLLDLEAPSASPATFHIWGPGSMLRTVDPQDLPGLTAADRSRLAVKKLLPVDRAAVQSAEVLFVRDVEAIVDLPSGYESLRDRIGVYVAEAGRPRFDGRALLVLSPVLFALAFVGAWIWTEASVPLPASVHYLGWLGTAAVLAMSAWAVFGLRRFRERPRGHFVRNESRTATFARRADARANVRVAFLSVLITVVIGALAGLLRLPGR